jgi:allantoicase
MHDAINLPTFAQNAINLASPRLGAKAIFATDEFFAPKERMLDDTPVVFLPDGGVAQLRVYGEPQASWTEGAFDAVYELSASTMPTMVNHGKF